MWRPFRKLRPRLRVRTLLALVALAAALIAAEQMRRRFVFCREKVRFYTTMEAHFLKKVEAEERKIQMDREKLGAARERMRRETRPRYHRIEEDYVLRMEEMLAQSIPFHRDLANDDRRMVEYCARLKDHYQAALRRPWAAVKPHESEPANVP